jgi:hypothetical protein
MLKGSIVSGGDSLAQQNTTADHRMGGLQLFFGVV